MIGGVIMGLIDYFLSEKTKRRIVMLWVLGIIRDKDFQRITNWVNLTPAERRQELGEWMVKKAENVFPDLTKIIESEITL